MPEAVALEPNEPLVMPAPEVAAPETPAAPAEAVTDGQDTGEQAPPTKPEGEKPEVITPEQAAKREGRRFERKLDKAFRKAAEAEARAELLQRQLEEARRANAPRPKLQGAPRLEDFEFDAEKYAQALADFKMREGLRQLQTAQQQQAAKETERRLVAKWVEKAAKGEAKYDDFDEVVGELKPTTPTFAAIMDAENGEEIAYYLSKHPKEAQRIATLDLVSQVREIGRLEATLLAEPEKPKTPSKAPAPITPLGGKSGGTSDVPLDTDDINTWMKKANALARKQAGGT